MTALHQYRVKGKRWSGIFLFFLLLAGCRPEIPVLSSIRIDGEGISLPVNKDLYGLSLEEINHSIDGGLYAELIRNRSFEEGVPPLNCPYDAARNLLVTPNGWTIPFVRPDSIPGWRRLSENTALWPDHRERINDKNNRALLVSVYATAETGRGGAVAEGYRGIPIRKGEKYRLSLFAKGSSMIPKTLRIALEDSAARRKASDVFTIAPVYQWQRFWHTFTATEDMERAVLTVSADSTALFWIDVVSLFPEKVWKDRPNGQRPDLMEKIVALSPRFVRFPGGSYAEGYTAGTFPLWKESVGDISERKHFWNVWAYGSTNGMGFHEFLQWCEDLGAEPVYVMHSGVTNQRRRPRYEDITAMDKRVQEALDAIAYANAPADSGWGKLRARNGHAEPFHLKYIEIGSENYGQEYTKRFDLFRKAIRKAYPDITIISNPLTMKPKRGDWTDTHFYSHPSFFAANARRFEGERFSRRRPEVFIGEFGMAGMAAAGTLEAAVGEACFLVGAERNPETVKRLAYAPVLGNVHYPFDRYPLISFDHSRIVTSPSYHVWQLFANHRGDELLKTSVETYRKPQITSGRIGIEMFDNSFDIEEAVIDSRPVIQGEVLSGGWSVNDGVLTAEANRWNDLLVGDSSLYNYEFAARIRRTKGSGGIRFHVRDNGRRGGETDFIAWSLGTGVAELYRQAGEVKDSLAFPKPFRIENNRWYKLRVQCENERIRCFVDGMLVQEARLPSIPSLVAVATLDTAAQAVWVKVVNTTRHEEKTRLDITGLTVKNTVEAITLTGQPEQRNTFADPEAIRPVHTTVAFSLGGTPVYIFPPMSVTLLRLDLE